MCGVCTVGGGAVSPDVHMSARKCPSKRELLVKVSVAPLLPLLGVGEPRCCWCCCCCACRKEECDAVATDAALAFGDDGWLWCVWKLPRWSGEADMPHFVLGDGLRA